ncbi:unnamed protein product [Gemmata massiliana]|uniref:HEAT repeat domain-containing protein n=1 Tax=Gemmata massiliana TaxID=1210884 RepID=A0A6P2CZ42_9BACT|nr:hypothetical protein [Gemmata massiliana]VTR94123.1 unnamed protein product [Gemmata massiliana]
MYRSLLALIALIALLSNVPAAPVPNDPAGVRKLLDAKWAELEKDEFAASRALLALSARPKEAIPFLREQLKPLKLTQDQAKRLLKDLGSDKEEVWKGAFHEMEYLDPRLTIGLVELMDQVTETPARQRLVAVLTGYEISAVALLLGEKGITLSDIGKGEGYNFRSDRGSWWAEHRVERLNIGGNRKRKWTQTVRAIALLEFFGTPDAVAILKNLATGHPDAQPTKMAKEALDRLKDKP